MEFFSTKILYACEGYYTQSHHRHISPRWWSENTKDPLNSVRSGGGDPIGPRHTEKRGETMRRYQRVKTMNTNSHEARSESTGGQRERAENIGGLERKIRERI